MRRRDDPGALDLESPERSVLALEFASPVQGQTIGGLLGYDFIRRFVVEIDYTAHVINLYRPRGYRYRPVLAGATLNRLFWGSNYRIGNYAAYRLPYPGRNRMYVRYGNDVLLINARNGRVIQVYNGFFY